jgi:SOS-response transcriptional repressor LexA
MMAAPKTQFEVRRRANESLTAVEQRVYEICVRAAEEGRELDSIEDMRMELGALSYSTIPGIMKRLEEKGYISRTIYQKGRRVCITSSGQCTTDPSNTAPHWRLRTEKVPAPAIHQIRERAKPLAQMIEAKARSLGKPVHEFLMDCVYVGFHEIMHDAEEV